MKRLSEKSLLYGNPEVKSRISEDKTWYESVSFLNKKNFLSKFEEVLSDEQRFMVAWIPEQIFYLEKIEEIEALENVYNNSIEKVKKQINHIRDTMHILSYQNASIDIESLKSESAQNIFERIYNQIYLTSRNGTYDIFEPITRIGHVHKKHLITWKYIIQKVKSLLPNEKLVVIGNERAGAHFSDIQYFNDLAKIIETDNFSTLNLELLHKESIFEKKVYFTQYYKIPSTDSLNPDEIINSSFYDFIKAGHVKITFLDQTKKEGANRAYKTFLKACLFTEEKCEFFNCAGDRNYPTNITYPDDMPTVQYDFTYIDKYFGFLEKKEDNYNVLYPKVSFYGFLAPYEFFRAEMCTYTEYVLTKGKDANCS